MTNLQIRATGPENGPAVVFLHGFMGSGKDWSEIATAFPNHRCLVVDLPGHGGNPIDPNDSLESVAEALQWVIHENGVISAHFVGYSLGGRIVMTLLRTLPECVQSAFLISTSPGIRDESLRKGRLHEDQSLAERLRSEPLSDFLDWWYELQLFCGLKNRPDAFKTMLDRRLENDADDLAMALENFSPGRMAPCHEALAEANVPVHYEVGALDEKYFGIADRIEGNMVQTEIIPGCSHTIPTEDPAELTQRLKTWFRVS